MRTGYEMTNLIERVLREAAANKEQAILAQLNDLISTGVLTVQEQAPILVRGSLSDTLEIRQMVKLSFEGAERLKALEQENTALKARIDEMRSVFTKLEHRDE